MITVNITFMQTSQFPTYSNTMGHPFKIFKPSISEGVRAHTFSQRIKLLIIETGFHMKLSQHPHSQEIVCDIFYIEVIFIITHRISR